MTPDREKMVLGTCIMYPEMAMEMIPSLSAEMFQSSHAKILFTEIRDISMLPTERITYEAIESGLRNKSMLNAAGGVEFLAACTTASDPIQCIPAAKAISAIWTSSARERLIDDITGKRSRGEITWDQAEPQIVDGMAKIRERGMAWDAKFKEWERRTFDINSPPEKPNILGVYQGGELLSDENLSLITGPEKVGKSGVVGAIMAGTAGASGPQTLGLQILPNTTGQAVVRIDTEQSTWDHYKTCLSILKRTGKPSVVPPWLKSTCLKGMAPEAKMEHIDIALSKYSHMFGGIYLIIIDGLADLVSSVNDEGQSNKVMNWCEQLATKYKCPVIIILHHNPGSMKVRGHIGTAARNKVASEICVERGEEDGISIIKFRSLRNAGRIPAITMYYDQEEGMHLPTDFIDRRDFNNDQVPFSI